MVEDFTVGNTGVTSVVRQIATWQARHCEWVGVYASGRSDQNGSEGVFVFDTETTAWSRGWRYPVGGAAALERVLKEHDVNLIHIHGLWRASTLVSIRAALRSKIPSILSVHGQTASWALSGQGFLKYAKKKLYGWLVGQAMLKKVDYLHAITPIERKGLELFLGRHVDFVIPNAILAASYNGAETKPLKYLAFLGRLHPVKGVLNLIEAFLAANIGAEWQLLIAGPEEDAAYVAKLKAAAQGSTRIKFIGPVFGAEKINFLKQAWTLVVPSYTEVIGMVNLEAGLCGTPSVTTPETGLSDWARGGGILVNNEKSNLRMALEEVASWTLDERLARGERSQQLIMDVYLLDVVGAQWLKAYESAIQ